MARPMPVTRVDMSPEGVLSEHGPAVWSLCRRLTPDPEDAYQDVWALVLPALSRFDPDGPASLRTWILTITHRHLIDRHRRRQVRGEVVPLGELPADLRGADEAIDAERGRRRLEAGIAALPDAHRRLVLAHDLHDVALADLADAEGVPLGTIKSRLHRARARLVELLGGRR